MQEDKGKKSKKLETKILKYYYLQLLFSAYKFRIIYKPTIQNNKRVFAGYKINILKPVTFLYTSNYNFKM